MSEHMPLRKFYAEKEPTGYELIPASKLKPGDYSMGASKRIERIEAAPDGSGILVYFERDAEQIRNGEKTLPITLRPDEELEISRGSFHSFTKDRTSDSGTPL